MTSQHLQKLTAIVVRTLAKRLGFLRPGTSVGPGEALAIPDEGTPADQTLSGFFKQVARDDALKMRFAEKPQEVLAERGLDLPNFDIPERFTTTEVDQLLTRWPALMDPTVPPWLRPTPRTIGDVAPPNASQQDGSYRAPRPMDPVHTYETLGPEPIAPPASVYGPPPGPRR